jgi:hypothetical protein
MTLASHKFLRRFLLHVLPRAFVRIRNFGFLATRRRATLLPLCRQLLQASAANTAAATAGSAVRPQSLWLCLNVVALCIWSSVSQASAPRSSAKERGLNYPIPILSCLSARPVIVCPICLQRALTRTISPFRLTTTAGPTAVHLRAQRTESASGPFRSSCSSLNLHSNYIGAERGRLPSSRCICSALAYLSV